MIHLGVNVDHVATIREARGTTYPDPIEAAHSSIRGGANQVTIHLREDRRHIQDNDLLKMRNEISVPLNLEMAASDEIMKIACEVKPQTVTLVPEKREELTTEGGLDVVSNIDSLRKVVSRLKNSGITVSMFIDPEISQIEASLSLGSNAIEFHTGAFCDAKDDKTSSSELERLIVAVRFANKTNLKLCAGHGLNYSNIHEVVRSLPQIIEYNIGHAIVARAIFVGMEKAVKEMKQKLETRN